MLHRRMVRCHLNEAVEEQPGAEQLTSHRLDTLDLPMTGCWEMQTIYGSSFRIEDPLPRIFTSLDTGVLNPGFRGKSLEMWTPSGWVAHWNPRVRKSGGSNQEERLSGNPDFFIGTLLAHPSRDGHTQVFQHHEYERNECGVRLDMIRTYSHFIELDV